jgi:hypothetical protein
MMKLLAVCALLLSCVSASAFDLKTPLEQDVQRMMLNDIATQIAVAEKAKDSIAVTCLCAIDLYIRVPNETTHLAAIGACRPLVERRRQQLLDLLKDLFRPGDLKGIVP